VTGLGSVGGRLYLVLGMFALVLAGLSGVAVIHAWHSRARATDTAATAHVTRLLIVAMQNARIERGNSVSALAGPAPAMEPITKVVHDYRAASEAAYDKALQALSAAGQSDVVATLHSRHDTVQALRSRVDDALRQPLAQRDAGLLRDWPPAIGGWFELLSTLSGQMEQHIALLDPMIDRLLTIKHALLSIRAAAGNQALTIVGAIAGQHVPTADQQLLIANQRGQIIEEWQTLSWMASSDAVAPSVRQAIDGMRTGYIGWSDSRLEPVYKALLAGNPGVTFQQFSVELLGALATIDTAVAAGTDALEAIAIERQNAATQQFAGACSLALLSLLLLGLGMFTVRRRVLRRIAGLTGSIQRLAAGDTDAEIAVVTGDDEFSGMRRALLTLREHARAAATAAEERLAEQSQIANRGRTIELLSHEFDTGIGATLTATTAATEAMHQNTSLLSDAVRQTADQANSVAGDASQASQNVQSVAAASEELSLAIAEISRQVQRAASVTSEVTGKVQHTDAVASGLVEAAKSIESIMVTINTIAAQTNLLALNATIEAARAGEAGKGFAVVAGEVKLLASQTSKATEDIAAQIQRIQTVTGEAVTGIRDVRGGVDEISQIASMIAASVEQQGAATAEIAHTVQVTAGHVAAIAATISDVRSVAEGAAETVAQTVAANRRAAGEIDQVRDEVTNFLNRLRSA
jgi:methyl-accepting chemotaxis protein